MLYGNTAYCVRKSGEDLSRCSNEIESVALRKCPHYHCLTKNDVTITDVSQSLPHIMAGKQLAYRYGMKKLRHCHPVYTRRDYSDTVTQR